MAIESGAYNEQEKKRKKLNEQQEKLEQKKLLEQQKTKEYIKTEIETEEKLQDLHDLVDKGLISKETVQKIIEGEEVEQEVIQEIFDKIDAMEDLDKIDNYLPVDLRITKDEYVKALHDDVFRVQTLTKLSTALTIIAEQIQPDAASSMSLFSGFLTLLDKNLVLVQEHTIDIKNNLEKIHESKFPKLKVGFWKQLIKFFK